MKKFVFLLLFLSMAALAEEPSAMEVSADSVSAESVQAVSLAPMETCPSDSILSADYAKCKQALTIAVGAQMDRNANRDRSMEMASTAGAFVGGALLGFLLGWLVF